jgi:hypothetical protein
VLLGKCFWKDERLTSCGKPAAPGAEVFNCELQHAPDVLKPARLEPQTQVLTFSRVFAAEVALDSGVGRFEKAGGMSQRPSHLEKLLRTGRREVVSPLRTEIQTRQPAWSSCWRDIASDV